jgi:hypothetical protein
MYSASQPLTSEISFVPRADPVQALRANRGHPELERIGDTRSLVIDDKDRQDSEAGCPKDWMSPFVVIADLSAIVRVVLTDRPLWSIKEA